LSIYRHRQQELSDQVCLGMWIDRLQDEIIKVHRSLWAIHTYESQYTLTFTPISINNGSNITIEKFLFIIHHQNLLKMGLATKLFKVDIYSTIGRTKVNPQIWKFNHDSLNCFY